MKQDKKKGTFRISAFCVHPWWAQSAAEVQRHGQWQDLQSPHMPFGVATATAVVAVAVVAAAAAAEVVTYLAQLFVGVGREVHQVLGRKGLLPKMPD